MVSISCVSSGTRELEGFCLNGREFVKEATSFRCTMCVEIVRMSVQEKI